MTTTAICTMVIICSLVWGGFVTLLIRALRHEGKKRTAASGQDG